MSILVIDDDPRRIEGFRQAFGRDRLAFAYDLLGLVQAVRCIEKITTIYLDHDGVDGDLIAEYMARHGLHKSAKIIIHSSNYTGSIKMRDVLQAAGYDVEIKPYSEIVGDDTDTD